MGPLIRLKVPGKVSLDSYIECSFFWNVRLECSFLSSMSFSERVVVILASTRRNSGIETLSRSHQSLLWLPLCAEKQHASAMRSWGESRRFWIPSLHHLTIMARMRHLSVVVVSPVGLRSLACALFCPILCLRILLVCFLLSLSLLYVPFASLTPMFFVSIAFSICSRCYLCLCNV